MYKRLNIIGLTNDKYLNLTFKPKYFCDIVHIKNSAQIIIIFFFVKNCFVTMYSSSCHSVLYDYVSSVELKYKKFSDCFQCYLSYNYSEQGLKIRTTIALSEN